MSKRSSVPRELGGWATVWARCTGVVTRKIENLRACVGGSRWRGGGNEQRGTYSLERAVTVGLGLLDTVTVGLGGAVVGRGVLGFGHDF